MSQPFLEFALVALTILECVLSMSMEFSRSFNIGMTPADYANTSPEEASPVLEIRTTDENDRVTGTEFVLRAQTKQRKGDEVFFR